jgi:hypothetical protein
MIRRDYGGGILTRLHTGGLIKPCLVRMFSDSVLCSPSCLRDTCDTAVPWDAVNATHYQGQDVSYGLYWTGDDSRSPHYCKRTATVRNSFIFVCSQLLKPNIGFEWVTVLFRYRKVPALYLSS